MSATRTLLRRQKTYERPLSTKPGTRFRRCGKPDPSMLKLGVLVYLHHTKGYRTRRRYA